MRRASRGAVVDTLVVIPAFNEAQALPSTLADLRSIARYAVLVVDDGSADQTAAIAGQHGATVVRLPFNLGVGAAVRAGLRYAVDHCYQRVVVVDADGQHDVASIAALLGALDAGADVAVGSRFAPGAPDYAVGRVRKAAMASLGWIVHRLTHQRLTDVTSGFRAFDRPVIELLAREYPVEYLADTVEVLLRCHAAGFTIVEVPVAMRPRQAGRPSSRNITLIVNYLRLLIGVASWRWRQSLPPPPAKDTKEMP
jgi:glycosyltransferase involved in cell wall biosynthesis